MKRTKELSQIKAIGHNLYNNARNIGLSHQLALSAVMEKMYEIIVEGAVPKDAPPAEEPAPEDIE